MGRELEARLPPPDLRVTRRMLKAVNAYLFGDGTEPAAAAETAAETAANAADGPSSTPAPLGFRGANSGEAASPDASCLDQVMDRKMGLPIMLSLVYLEVTRRVGFAMIGVNLPAHFMIRPVVEGSELLVDPFRMVRHEAGAVCARSRLRRWGSSRSCSEESSGGAKPRGLSTAGS